MGYAGEYHDPETGFIYLRARYYDPTIGRFINEDPIRDSLNWYVYCNNNPVRFIDPSGCIGIMPDGSIYMDENDTEVDKLLLEYKISYMKASTDSERESLAAKAAILREENPGQYHVLAEDPIDIYYIPDVTNELNSFIRELEPDFYDNPRNFFWFFNSVKTNSVVDLKNTNDVFKRPNSSYHIIYNNQVFRADAPGNIAYGYLGTVACFYDFELLYGAGLYQMYENAGGNVLDIEFAKIFTNYGDNPGDPEQIKYGIKMYKDSRPFDIRIYTAFIM